MTKNKILFFVFNLIFIFGLVFLPKISLAQDTYYFADPIEDKSQNEACQEFKPNSLQNDTVEATSMSVCQIAGNIKIDSSATGIINPICCVVTHKGVGDEGGVTEQGTVIDPKTAQEEYLKQLGAEPKFDIPQFQIQIPGLELSDVECRNLEGGGYFCSIPWIGEYLQGIYNYSLSIAGILAAIMLMAAGVLWLTSRGDSGQVSKAKNMIFGSILGLAILFLSYTILYTINPELVKLRNIELGSGLQEGTREQIIHPGDSLIETEGWEWNSGIINQVGDASPELANFINCMRRELPDGVGRITSISDNNYIGNPIACDSTEVRGSRTCPENCAHGCGSCHYGGGLMNNKSYAVDMGMEDRVHIIAAAKKCGVTEGTSAPGYLVVEGTHLHMSVEACPRN